jgi:hypothetical protein
MGRVEIDMFIYTKSMTEQKQTLVWCVPAVKIAGSEADDFTSEEMLAWEKSKISTFEWLYDFDSKTNGDTSTQLEWKRHVAYLRKLLFENIDLTLYNTIEAVRKNRWEQISPYTLFPSGFITIPVPQVVSVDEEELAEEDMVGLEE